MEPLLPALMCAIQSWAARTDVLTVVHDEQSALTPWRTAEMGARLAAQPSGGRLESVHRVDSRDEPRVQVADLLAGLARRWAAATLASRNDAAAGHTRPSRSDLDLGPRLQPLVAPRSVWVEPSALTNEPGKPAGEWGASRRPASMTTAIRTQATLKTAITRRRCRVRRTRLPRVPHRQQSGGR